MWIYAYMQNAVPETVWKENQGNHRPWRYSYDLQNIYWLILNIQLLSFNLSIISFIIKPNREAAIVSGIALVIFFLFMYTHYWLID